jgi:hypothetical protein
MSIKMAMEIKALQDSEKQNLVRVDKLEEEVKLLKKSVSHIERTPVGDGGLRVPPTALPDTLGKLELGKDSQGE